MQMTKLFGVVESKTYNGVQKSETCVSPPPP